jgi:hypothetical protein
MPCVLIFPAMKNNNKSTHAAKLGASYLENTRFRRALDIMM